MIHRIEASRCGELVHIDVKQLVRVADGGGHRKLGRSTATRSRGGGYTHIHTAIDGYGRLAYSEFAGVERTTNCGVTPVWRTGWLWDHATDVASKSMGLR